MPHFGLIGYPIEHSLSPVLHRLFMEASGIQGEYSLFSCPDTPSFYAVLQKLQKGEVLGLNVTTPHKHLAYQVAKATGWSLQTQAVNTLWLDTKTSTVMGTQTDVDGVQRPFQGRGIDVAGKEVLVLGGGGAAQAAMVAMHGLGARVVAATRTGLLRFDSGQALSMLSSPILSWDDGLAMSQALVRCDVLIQATPVGRQGESLALPLDNLRSEAIVFEMLYKPYRTSLLSLAEAKGCMCIYGWEMLFEQGMRAFEIWNQLSFSETQRQALRLSFQQGLAPTSS